MAKRVKKPKSKTRKIIEGVLTGIIVGLLGFVAVSLITGMIFKRHGVSMMFNSVGSCYVLTDSMDPVYPEKSTILVQKCKPQELVNRLVKGETVDVTFLNVDRGVGPYIPEGKNPSDVIVTNQIMTHRLIGYWVDDRAEVTEGNGKYYFFASGINYAAHIGGEGQYQVFTEVDLVGRVVGKSQFLGWMTQFITSWYGLLILLLIPSAYMIVTSVLDIFKAYNGDDEDDDKVVAEVDGNASSVPPGENGDVLGGLSDADRERLKQELLDEMLNKKKGE